MNAQLIRDIEAVEKLLDSPEKWTKKALARNSSGCVLENPKQSSACCWCLEGAMMTVNCHSEARRLVIDLQPEWALTTWNDAPERTYADVMALLRRAKGEARK